MRRSADQQHLDDLARRRLDALIAELGGQTDAPAAATRPRESSGSVWDDAVPPPRHGRHAHRPLSVGARLGGWLQDRLPETLRGRVALGPAQIGVVTLLLACGVLWAAWATSRTAAEPVSAAEPVVVAPAAEPAAALASSAAPAPQAAAGGGGPGAEPAASGQTVAVAELVVDVQGAVRRPGIVVLPTGSRVVDALEAAGGYTGRRARLANLNLARALVDGEQILVGRSVPAAPVPSALTGAPSAGATGQLVSLNSADQVALETLPGVGPVTAAAILQWRDEHGPFTAVDQLLEVSGIGEKTLAVIAPHVTL
jgi:competence protein ComEA